MDHYETTLAGYGTRMDSVESAIHALCQHFIPSVYATSPPHSPTHFTLTFHASHRHFPTASEDRETLGSLDTIDPSDLLPPTSRIILQLVTRMILMPLMTLMLLRLMILTMIKTLMGLSL